MPIVSGKTISAQTVANGSANFAGNTGAVAQAGPAFASFQLDVPSLNRLTWVVIQAAGVDSALVQPQVAFRRGAAGALLWENILPAALASPTGVPLVLTLNTVAVQAMRLVLSHSGQQGAAAISARYYLSGSA
jgi:hypothetical protein